MPTADWDALTPTDGTPANAYELGLDVLIGAAYTNVPDITALNPQPQPQTRNRSTYATKGQPIPTTFARGMQISVNVEAVRDDTGQFQDELQYLIDKAALLGNDNTITARIFDTLGADFAWEADWGIEFSRPNTGDQDAGFFGFTLTAKTAPTKITNPVNDDADPGIASILPSGQAEGDTVLVSGINLTGATGISFGGTAGTIVEVVDDRHIVATVPAGSAGSVNVTVTTSVGTSTALAYTRGA